METFDLVVIGAGPGGYPAAIRAAQLGVRTAIVEREFLGGTCLNCGCIPTKTLIAASSLYAKIEDGAEVGIKATGRSVDYKALTAHKERTIGKLRDGVGRLLKGAKITVFNGTASYVDRNTVRVVSRGNREIEVGAAKTVIATGSTSAMPGFLQKHKRVIDSRAFLELKKMPKSLLVLGGGYIGCELACMAAQIGSSVTIVELLHDILPLLDSDVRREIRRHMEKKLGIRILAGKAMKSAKADGKGVSATVGVKRIKADLLLVAVGRVPVTDGLDLENAGVEIDDRGFVKSDDFNRTSAATVYAVGDVTGKVQLAHAATSQGIIAAENAFSGKLRKNETVIPAVIFTTPEAATVGLSQSEAAEKGIQVRTARLPFVALGRAVASHATDGFVKWVADAETGQVLGASAVGAHATDLIAEASLAVRNELTVEEVAHTIHAHPTFGESWMEAAAKLADQAV